MNKDLNKLDFVEFDNTENREPVGPISERAAERMRKANDAQLSTQDVRLDTDKSPKTLFGKGRRKRMKMKQAEFELIGKISSLKYLRAEFELSGKVGLNGDVV